MDSPDVVRETLADAQAMGAKMMQLHLPFLKELKSYSSAKFRADLIAGATLTLVSIPQAVGFALILKLPPQAVIVSVIIGGFVGAFFFSSRHHVFGPTSSISLITAVTIAGYTSLGFDPLQLAVLLALLIGAIQLLAGLLNFGEVTKFISRAVVVAYSTGIGLLLIVSQLHNLLGSEAPARTSFAFSIWSAVAQVIEGKVSLWGAGAGALTLLLFGLLRRWRPKWPEALLVLAVMGLAVRVLAHYFPEIPIRLVRDEGALTAVLPSWAGFQWSEDKFEAFQELFKIAVAIACIGMLEATAITKALAAKSGQKIEPNQELVGMGVANIACALFSGVPGSSSFARSSVSYQSGAATQVSSMLSSVVVLAVLMFITPIFNYIPVAALAAHLIRVGFKMINWHEIRVCCRSTRSDAMVFAITLISALFLKLDTAIYVGIGVSLAVFLQKSSTPLLVEYTFNDSGVLTELSKPEHRTNPLISIIHVEGDLYFGAADLFQEQVRRQAEDQNIKVFILRMKNARHLDASTVLALENLHDYLRQTGRYLVISGMSELVGRVLRNSGLYDKIGAENIFPVESNPTISTKRALERATQLLQTRKAEVRIFYDRPQNELPEG